MYLVSLALPHLALSYIASYLPYLVLPHLALQLV